MSGFFCVQGAGSNYLLKDIFRQFGKVAEVTVPVNKATNSTKGFAFVAFANGLAADRCAFLASLFSNQGSSFGCFGSPSVRELKKLGSHV